MSLVEVGKSDIYEITSPDGGVVANAFNRSHIDYWEPDVKADADGYLSKPVEVYISFLKYINVEKFSISKGLFGNTDFKYSLASPRDFKVYVSDTCIKVIPECIEACKRPDPSNPSDPEASILIDYAPNWRMVLDVVGRGSFSSPLFNGQLSAPPFNMSSSLVYGSNEMYKETMTPCYIFDNFEIGGVKRINRIKVVITRINAIEDPSRRITNMNLTNMRLLGS